MDPTYFKRSKAYASIGSITNILHVSFAVRPDEILNTAVPHNYSLVKHIPSEGNNNFTYYGKILS